MIRYTSLILLGLLASSFYCLQTALAQTPLSPRAERGQTFARANCAHCHSIDKVSPSPLAIAPPFRTLHQRYPVTGHANMPEFRLEPDQIGHLIAFLKTLER